MKPVLFNTSMVQANLEDRKTNTRRLIKPQPKSPVVWHCGEWQETKSCANGLRVFTPPYKPGDILYVRETWRCEEAGYPPGYCIIGYKAGGTAKFNRILALPTIKWKPSIHMPKKAARLFLRVISVRAEQLQDISPDECAMEGIWPLYSGPVGGRDAYYRQAFAKLWDSTIKKNDRDTYGWDANPWVWVIKYEKISKEEAYGQ